MTKTSTATPSVASRDEWLHARRSLLAREKELTRARDALNAERRRLPMVRIDEPYSFDGPEGRVGLLDLFDGRRQLIVYHFMFAPEWDQGCPVCSLVADNIGHLSHLHARNTSLVMVSRAPLDKLERYKARMGWTVPWYSSFGSDFNYDFHVTLDADVAPVTYNYDTFDQAPGSSMEAHGLSVFLRDGREAFHTYSSYARGCETLIGTFDYLDLTPLGRQEAWEEPPGRSDDSATGWPRRHDEYRE